jgi:hypothetical protein
MHCHLFSISCATEKGATFNFARNKCSVRRDQATLIERERHGYIERRERTGKREGEAHTRTPTRVKRPGQPH